MIIRKFSLLAILMLVHNVYAQRENSNLSKENQELLLELKQQEEKRLNRINLFLENNPNIKVTYNDGFNFKHIYDILDGKPIYRSTYNLGAARATKTDRLRTGGSLGLNLDGSGMTVGVWDGGPADNSHPEFDTRVTVVDFTMSDTDEPGPYSDHGTHVTGTIAANGTNPNALGMAPNVNVKSFNWTNDESEMINAANDITNPIYLSNHSYGIPSQNVDPWYMGAYTEDARDIDNIARNNPKYLIVASAGNSGTYTYTGGLFSGFDKLTSDKNAKNNLVIANANPSTSEQPVFSGNFELTNLVINPGSSEGPTDDLRIKPDIAADGTNLESTVQNNGYAVFSGTSMSAPNTTGTLVLIQQYYNQIYGEFMNSSTLKGLVTHTAVDDNFIGPDPIFGWGFLDANAAVQTITDASNSAAVVDELTLDQGGVYTFTFNVQEGSKLSATICWTDIPGGVVANGTLNDQTPRLVNDLDLRLTKDGTDFFPWRLDYNASSGFSNSKGDNVRDNIERVDIEMPTSGLYTLTVTHKGTLQGTAGGPFDPQSQDFSLIITGNNLTLSVDENDLTRKLAVYPNPSNGEFTITFESNLNSVDNNVKVDVYDLQGRLVYNNNFINTSSILKENIVLENAKAGVYMVNISEGNRTTSHKLVIE